MKECLECIAYNNNRQNARYGSVIYIGDLISLDVSGTRPVLPQALKQRVYA